MFKVNNKQCVINRLTSYLSYFRKDLNLKKEYDSICKHSHISKIINLLITI